MGGGVVGGGVVGGGSYTGAGVVGGATVVGATAMWVAMASAVPRWLQRVGGAGLRLIGTVWSTTFPRDGGGPRRGLVPSNGRRLRRRHRSSRSGGLPCELAPSSVTSGWVGLCATRRRH